MPEKITIVKDSGETLSTNLVSVFTIPENDKKYMITTENAVDPHGLTVLHVSEVIGDANLQKVATDEDWNTIKTVMRSIISGNPGSYSYATGVEKLKAPAQYSRDISVSASAASQMVENYSTGLTQVDAPVESMEDVAPVGGGSTIFPENNSEVNEDNEISPGIGEVEEAPEIPVVQNVEPEIVEAPIEEAVEEIVEEVVSDTPEVSEAPVSEKIPAVESVAPQKEVVTIQTVNNISEEDINELKEKVGKIDSVVDKVAAIDDLTAKVDVLTTTLNQLIEANTALQQVVSDSANNSQTQLAELKEVTLTSQEKQPYVLTEAKVPNFNPNASTEDVISGAQQLFGEGVKSLVDTITEKLYREFYEKDNELKQREAVINQREQMINDQMAAIVNNFGVLQQQISSATTTQINNLAAAGVPAAAPTVAQTPVAPVVPAVPVAEVPVQVQEPEKAPETKEEPKTEEAKPFMDMNGDGIADDTQIATAEPAQDDNQPVLQAEVTKEEVAAPSNDIQTISPAAIADVI